jgi:hypothetical protein
MKKKYEHILTPSFLQEATEQKLTNTKIGEILGINKNIVRDYRKRANLLSRKALQLEKGRELRKIPIPKDLIGLIVGTVLGDGYLSQHSTSHNTNLAITHCPKQKKYALLKYFLLKQLCINEPFERERADPNLRIYYVLETIYHPDLNLLRNLIYKDGKKIVTKEVLNLLTVPGFALWFMDDGFKKSGKKHVYGLCTHGFSLEENKLIREHFFKKFNIKTTILTSRNKYDKKYYYLHFAQDTVQIFEKLVAPFIIPCMLHKMNSEALVKYLGSSETICKTSLWNCFLKDDEIVRTMQKCIEVSRND